MRKKIQAIITHPLFSGSLIMIVGSNATNFLNYLYHLVLGRMLGPTNYGELASIISTAGLLGVIPASISIVIVKYVSSGKNDDEIKKMIGWFKSKIFLISAIFFLVILIASPFIASFLRISNIYYLILLAGSLFFSLMAAFNRAILQGVLKFKEIVFSVLVENSSKLFISITLVYLGFQVGGAMSAFLMAAVLGWYLTNFYLKNYLPKNEKKSFSIHTRPMFLFVVPVILQSLATTSLYSSDVILVKHFFSSHDAGIYAALSTLGKIIFFGTGPISTVMFPLVSQRQAQGKDYKKIFLYSFLATAMLAMSILLLYWLFPAIAINLLYGSKYLEASGLLVWYGLFITFFALSSLFINYGLSIGKTSIVSLPFIAAFTQIIMIWFFHQSLYTVILISIIISALLLVSLLIYSTYEKRVST